MSDLGNKKVFAKNFKHYMELYNLDRYDICKALGFKYSTVSEWLAGNKYPRIDKIELLANYFKIQKSDLIEDKENISYNTDTYRFPPPNITEEYTTFPVIGDIAAGFDNMAVEDWNGDLVDIPNSYLRGRSREEFFVLRVKGDSMYPMYQDGDKVLILKQSTLNYSGQVGAIMYDDDKASLKKIEYVKGEDWMRLVPINPNVPPEMIEGERLEHCHVLGIPKLLIRNIDC